MCVRERAREREREIERVLWTIPSPCEVDLIYSSISLRTAFDVGRTDISQRLFLMQIKSVWENAFVIMSTMTLTGTTSKPLAKINIQFFISTNPYHPNSPTHMHTQRKTNLRNAAR